MFYSVSQEVNFFAKKVTRLLHIQTVEKYLREYLRRREPFPSDLSSSYFFNKGFFVRKSNLFSDTVFISEVRPETG